MSGIQSLKTSCQSLDFSHISEIPDPKPQSVNLIDTSEQRACDVLEMPYRAPSNLNLFVNYDNEKHSDNSHMSDNSCLGLFKGDPVKNYPFSAPN